MLDVALELVDFLCREKFTPVLAYEHVRGCANLLLEIEDEMEQEEAEEQAAADQEQSASGYAVAK